MEALIRLCECTSKSSLDAYDIFFFFFLCCGSDYYVVYTINGRICRERAERERDVIPFLPKVVIPALPK